MNLHTLLYFSIQGIVDYLPLNTDITFEPQSDGQALPRCADITIVADGVLERDEMLSVEVVSSSPTRVLLEPSASTATIEIIDDDRK